MQRARLTIRGQVQGVWYRGSMQEEARRRHLVGWVQNQPDGTVVAEVEGEREAVEAMIAWARRGPPGARVAAVDVEWVTARGEERSGFAIRR